MKQRILRIMTHGSGTALSRGRKCLLCFAAGLVVAGPVGFGVLHGQSAAASGGYTWTPDMPKYEVASIKPSPPDDGRLGIRITPTGEELKSVTVEMLLRQAFGVEKDRIVGAPEWVRSKHYDVEAKVTPEDAPRLAKMKMEQRSTLMLPLLEDRFGLKYHHETRELPMYALVVAKGGPKLAESKPGEPMSFPEGHSGSPGPIARPDGSPGLGTRPVIGEGMRMSRGSIQSRGGNIAFLVHALSGMLGRTVVDKTGLTGNYDFSLNWTPDESMRNVFGGPQGDSPSGEAASEVSGPTLFTALEEQVGLRLESQKGPVDVIVIDHIDLPTEN